MKVSLLRLIVALLVSSSIHITQANTEKVYQGQEAQSLIDGAEVLRLDESVGLPSFIKLKASHYFPIAEFENFVRAQLKLSADFGLREIRRFEDDQLGMLHIRYQQTYKGLDVETGIFIAHTKDGLVQSMNGEIYYPAIWLTKPNIDIDRARAIAIDHVGAKKYKWEIEGEEALYREVHSDPSLSYYPKGQLVLAPVDGQYLNDNFRLSYKFNIYAHEPMSRKTYYVCASTGEIVWEIQEILDGDVPGSCKTAYSGTRSITTDSFGIGQYRLRETGRGGGVFTYDMNTGTDYSLAVDFTDTDNYWDNANPDLDEYAGDAHWGAEMFYDYFWTEHSRRSVDDADQPLITYVHYDVSYLNAFWNGSFATIGDGNTSADPLTSLDIMAHEFAHGVTGNSAGLIYANESGALNESFSDIFGETVENFGKGSNDWLMSGDIGLTFRSMADPNLYNDPKCYFGTHWYTGSADNGGVHTNSGVQNFWYYLMCQGGSGTNDAGDAYSVTAVGMTKAAQIAYRNLAVYLSSSSNYADAAFYAEQSAIDLFGACSPEHEATVEAWFACCVGTGFNPVVVADFSPSITYTCQTSIDIDFSNLSQNGDSWAWDFGDGGTSSVKNPTHTYTTAGKHSVTLIVSSGCGDDTITYTDLIEIDPPLAPTTTDDSACVSDNANLTASGGGELIWYNSSTGGTEVGSGGSYNPTVSGDQTYYVASRIPGDTVYGGPVDRYIGTGRYFTGNRHLIFDVNTDCTLKSVWMDINSTGLRTVEWRDSNGVVLKDTAINFIAGQGRYDLNIAFTPGKNYQLGISTSSTTDIYRNNGGVVYPYYVGGYATITNSSAGVPGYYYFFYDWEIQGPDCESPRTSVEVIAKPLPNSGFTTTVNGLEINFMETANDETMYFWDFGDGNTSTDPNPSHTYNESGVYTVMMVASNSCGSDTSYASFNVEGDGVSTIPPQTLTIGPNPGNGKFNIETIGFKRGDMLAQLIDELGRVHQVIRFDVDQFQRTKSINLSHYPAAAYFIRIIKEDENYDETFKLIFND